VLPADSTLRVLGCQIDAVDVFLAEIPVGDRGEQPDEEWDEPRRLVLLLPWDGRPSTTGCAAWASPACSISNLFVDPRTGTVLFQSSCDPFGANPFGEQLFAMRPDGTGLRQLTSARGMTTDPDGTIHVELPGPTAYTSPAGG
jgi:hypothetical protein